MAKHYICEGCGGTYESGRPEEEALAEFKANYPDCLPKDMAIICDDCHQRVMAYLKNRKLN